MDSVEYDTLPIDVGISSVDYRCRFHNKGVCAKAFFINDRISTLGLHLAEQRKSGGFTLIELSIVLVIIGLIVGGVLTGRELIRAASLKKVGTELSQLQTAVTTFRGNYDCLPGDCANATNFLGLDPNCPYGSNPVNGTCNGNGDGTVNSDWTLGFDEDSYVMNQLSLAGMWRGSYQNGPWTFYGSGHTNFNPGVNAPVSALSSNVGYIIFTVTPSTYVGLAAPNTPVGSMVIEIGATSTNFQDWLCGAGFNAVDANALDKKIDDGNAATGQLRGGNAWYSSPSNSNTTCLSGGDYSTSTATGCTLTFILRGQ